MFSLSPAKVLVILIVALVVLGPEKLPGMARQLGSLWADLRRLRARLESEVRGVLPDLPPTHELAQAVRSPLSYLNRLADEHEGPLGSAALSTVPSGEADPTRAPPPAGAGGAVAGPGASPPVEVDAGWPEGVVGDPSMN
jgi:sec-independent protein translocase protein TatB